MRDAAGVLHLAVNRQAVEMHGERLVPVLPRSVDLRDLTPGDGGLAPLPEDLEDRELFLLADAQRFVELAAGREDVGDLAPGDGGLGWRLP